jgi:hypothetical protein
MNALRGAIHASSRISLGLRFQASKLWTPIFASTLRRKIRRALQSMTFSPLNLAAACSHISVLPGSFAIPLVRRRGTHIYVHSHFDESDRDFIAYHPLSADIGMNHAYPVG